MTDRVRPIGGRVFAVMLKPETEETVIVPDDLPSSTCRVVASANPLFHVGETVLVDRGKIVLIDGTQERAGAAVVFYGEAGLAWITSEGIIPVEPYVTCEKVEEEGLIELTDRDLVTKGEIVWIKEWKTRAVVDREAGYVLKWKGQQVRIVDPEHIHATLSN